jgi:hypothetical protein
VSERLFKKLDRGHESRFVAAKEFPLSPNICHRYESLAC